MILESAGLGSGNRSIPESDQTKIRLRSVGTDISSKAHNWLDMTILRRAGGLAVLGISALLSAAFLGSVADEVYEESGIGYEEGHPTAYGGVQGWNPLRSLGVSRGRSPSDILRDC